MAESYLESLNLLQTVFQSNPMLLILIITTCRKFITNITLMNSITIRITRIMNHLCRIISHIINKSTQGLITHQSITITTTTSHWLMTYQAQIHPLYRQQFQLVDKHHPQIINRQILETLSHSHRTKHKEGEWWVVSAWRDIFENRV